MRDEVQELAFADSLARNDAGKIIRRQEASAVRLAGGEACKRAEAQAPDELPEPGAETPAFLPGEEELEALLEATADMDDEA